MKKLLTLLTLLCSITVLNAQAPVIQWQKNYGGTLSDEGGGLIPTSDGGFIFSGRTASSDVDVTSNHGGFDWWIVKLDVLGNIEWQQTYGGTADDIAYKIIQTTDGGYAIAGWTESNDGDVTGYHGGKDCWVIKINSTGVLQWQKSLGGTSEEEFRHIIQTSDGGFACVGWSASVNGDVSGLHGFRDTWLVKLDGSGNITWQKMLGGLNDERGYTVEQTTDGGYIVSSSSSSSTGDVGANYGSLDYWVAKTDNLGVIQWEQNYGGSGEENNRGTKQTLDGGYIVTGYTASSNNDVTGFHGVQDIWVVKIDNLGAIQWQKALGGSATDRGAGIVQTSDSGYVVSGLTASSNGDVSVFQGGFSDYWILKLSKTGVLEWEKTVGGTDDDAAGSVVLIPNGYMLSGTSNSTDGDVTNNKGVEDIWIVKLLNDCGVGSPTGTISGTESICTGGTANLNLSFTGTGPWQFSINGGPIQTSLTATTTVSVSPAVNTTYNLTYFIDNVCPTGNTSGTATVLVSSAPPLNSAKILTAPASACESSVVSLTAKVVAGQNILYRWTGPAGTLFSSAIGGPFSAGPFVSNSTQVYAQLGPLGNGISGYSICVQAYNGCGQSNQNCFWIRASVSQPGNITGDLSACASQTKTYSVNIPVGAQSINWSFSVPGATITPTTPAGNVVDVTFPAFTTGTLCVTAGLSCGGSSISPARCIVITATPARPNLISGNSDVCGGTTGTYSIAPVSGADNYTWSFGAAGALIDGNPSPYTTSSTSVTVIFPSGYNQNQDLCVTANNSCSSSTSRCKTIGNLVPARPGTITATPGTWCNNSNVSFSVAAVAGATTYNWTLSNGTINTGNGTNSIDATWGTGSGVVSVTASNTCGTSAPRTLNGIPNCRIAGTESFKEFNVYPNPATDKLFIDFTSTGGTYSVRLMNMNGQLLINETRNSKEGVNSSDFELNGVLPGVYILEFINGNEIQKTMVTVL